jgi:diguanylate cyclase (GGDEF)-like protein
MSCPIVTDGAHKRERARISQCGVRVLLKLLPLRVLLIEDNEDDASIVIRALKAAGYDVTATRVETAEDLRNALSTASWDLAIADYTMPAFSGMKALAIVREHGVDLPFIFVSGTIGEDVAVSAMKQGAHDYIIKGNLARLAPAVERELREAVVRRERTRANERVAYLAYHDPLTDLPNRALLNDRLQQAILTSRREDKEMALLILDLDGFKEVNDALGHHAGDRLLQQVAARLRRTLRESDTVARLGGDEFAMLLPVTDLEGAERTARKVLHDLDQPFLVDGRPLLVHGSIGIAGFPVHAANGQELLQKADAAMYLAKSNRSGYAVHVAGRDRRIEKRLALTAAMRSGIEGQEFMLDYQPIIDLRDGYVVGIEALLRWNHPHGRLMPEDFIRVAEHSGLITPLTEFSIDRALTEWPRRSDEPPFTISANLSPRSLHNPALPDRIRQTLRKHNADPSLLVLEITENVIMSDPERSTRCLSELHDMGVRLSVDDFGTGYSSLSYLRQLPVDELKIDKSFVIGLANGEDDALVRSIIDLAHNLRLRVIAEGVETPEARDRLRLLGCDAAQGYYIHRPGPAPAIAEWISAQYTST